jgi:hypothetical protein
MNITGSLVEYPRWADYYVPEDISDDYPAQDMDGAQGLEPLPEPSPEEAARDPNVRSKMLLARALRSKAITALYERACNVPTEGNKLGPWTIEFDRDAEGNARCLHYSRKIIMGTNFSDDEALVRLVFELMNAIFSEKYIAWDEEVRSGQMPCKTYVKENERQEFLNTFLHSQVMKNAIAEMGWSNELDYYAEGHEELRKIVEKSNGGLRLNSREFLEKMFKEVWIQQKYSTHADHYRRQWALLAPSSN